MRVPLEEIIQMEIARKCHSWCNKRKRKCCEIDFERGRFYMTSPLMSITFVEAGIIGK